MLKNYYRLILNVKETINRDNLPVYKKQIILTNFLMSNIFKLTTFNKF